MTFTTPLKLKLAALLAVLSVGLVAAIPAGAIVAPRKCGTVTAKGKKWPITADQIPCSTAKKWSVTFLKTGKEPRYYNCKRASSNKIYRYCASYRYDKPRTFFIFKPR
jgi:hypothetical protein